MQPNNNVYIAKSKASLQNTKFILRSLINSKNNELTVADLSLDYRILEGVPIPFVQLGYKRLDDFLRSLTDTLICHHLRDGTMTVSAVQSNSSQHISELVRDQKPPKGGRSCRPVASSRMRAPQPIYQPQRMQRNATSYQSRQPAAVQPVYQYRSVATRQFTQPTTASRLHPPAVTANASNRQPAQNAPAAVRRAPLLSQTPMAPKATSVNTKPNNEIIVISSDDSCRTDPRQKTTQHRPTSATPPVLVTSAPHSSAPTPPKTPVARLRPRPADTISGSSSEDDCNDRPRRPTAHARHTAASVPITQIRRPFNRQPSSSSRTSSTALANAAAAVPSGPTQQLSSSTQSSNSNSNQQQPPIVKHTPVTSITVPALSTAVRLVHTNDTSDALGGAALPQLRDDDPMFMSDLPDNVAKFGTTVAPARLPDGLAANSRLQLYVTEVNNPTKFWFHVQDDNHPLDLLMFQLENYYNNAKPETLQMRNYNAIPGLLCVARFERLWHRAIIVDRIKRDQTVKVHFFDYGTTAPVPLSDIQYMLRGFAQLPVQAHRGALHGVQPAGLKWCRDSTNAFLAYVAQVMLYGRITHVDPDSAVVRLELVNTTYGDTDVILHERLVLRKFAHPYSCLSANGQPIAHHSELHPTFEMLETGSYPSFSEIGMFIVQGIEYEAILDENPPPMQHQRFYDGCDQMHQQQKQRLRFHPTNPFAAGLDVNVDESNMDTFIKPKSSTLEKCLELWNII